MKASSHKVGTMTQGHPISAEPRAVQLTKSLVWPLMVLHVISAILGLAIMRSAGPTVYFEQYLPPREFEQATPKLLDTMFSAAQAAFIGFAAINAILFAVVGLGLRANRHWSRFLGLAFGILFLVSAAYSLLFATSYAELSGLAFFETMLSWVIVVVTVWWIIQALNKRTGEWFASHRQGQGS